MSGRRCETCEFLFVQQCRRHPPVIVESRSSRKEWPHVEWSDWCGEWQPNAKLRSDEVLNNMAMIREMHAIMDRDR